jgi:hypothetical protein
MRNSLKMDVLDELRLFREKRLSNSTLCTPVSYSNLNMNLNLNLKLESETVERIVYFIGGVLCSKTNSILKTIAIHSLDTKAQRKFRINIRG